MMESPGLSEEVRTVETGVSAWEAAFEGKSERISLECLGRLDHQVKVPEQERHQALAEFARSAWFELW